MPLWNFELFLNISKYLSMQKQIFFTLILFVTSRHICSVVPTPMRFSDILKVFQECSIIYFHLSQATFQTRVEYQDEVFTEVIETFNSVFRESLLQYKISMRPTGTEIIGISSSRYKFSLCTVVIFLAEHVQVSQDIIKINKAPEERSEFIWYLKPVDKSHKEKPYTHLRKSFKPAIYLEIQNYVAAFYVCIPCENDNMSSTVDTPDTSVTVSDIRKNWDKLHENLRKINIHVPQGRVTHSQISYYFHSGHSAPCAQYPGKAFKFRPNMCAIILLSSMKNFTMLLGWVPDDVIRHSTIRFELNLDDRNVVILKWIVHASTNYGVEFIHFAFVTFFKKQLIKINHADIIQHFIFAPFPRWTWVSVGAFGVTTSVMFSFGMGNLKGAWISAVLTPTNLFLLIDQPIPRISCNDRLAKLGLMTAWCAFCLIISNAYKGFIFSCLTGLIRPVVPETLVDLLESGMVIGTTDFFQQELAPTKCSTLKFGILPEIISGIKDSEKIYSSLKDCVHQFDPDLVELSVQ